MPSIVQDRLRLLRTTHAQPSPILVTYDDPYGDIDAALRIGSEPLPVVDLTDDHGTHLRMWRVTDADLQERIHGILIATEEVTTQAIQIHQRHKKGADRDRRASPGEGRGTDGFRGAGQSS